MNKGKKVMAALIIFIGVILILFGAFALMSPGTIRTYKGEKSLSEKFVMDINGAPNGFFINSVNTDNPVLLFVSSGPGTDDYMFTDKYEDMRLEEAYTVVYWDYRGMGIAYDSGFDKSTVTADNLLRDTKAVTDYLKERFGKEKIYIMGFSGGTKIALHAALIHPEDYYAYIAMAQCVTDSPDNDTAIYDFALKVFEQRGDKRNLKKLEDSVEHLDDGRVKCNDWYEYCALLHEAGGGTILNKSEFEGIVLPILCSKCYTIREKLGYVPAMKMYRKTPLAEEWSDFDYRKEITKLQIPAYFISGDTDYNCPWELVEEYCDILEAPDKGFYKISNSAHSPLWENPEETCGILRQIKEKCSG